MILTMALVALAAATYEPSGENFARNPSFEVWKAGAPMGWELEVGACDDWRGTTARQSADSQDGKVSVKLRPPADPAQEIRLRQAITIDRATLPLGGRLYASVATQAFAPGAVVLTFQFRQGGVEHSETAAAIGNGAWERLALEFVLPPDAERDSLTITLTRAAGQPGDILIDDVQVRGMVEAVPPPPDDAAPRIRKKPHGVHP